MAELLDTVLVSRRTLPAATFQMIDFSAADNSLPEVNVDPHEGGYEPDCEQPEISVPEINGFCVFLLVFRF